MKLEIAKEELQKLLEPVVQAATARKNYEDISEHSWKTIFLEVGNGVISATGADDVAEVRVEIPYAKSKGMEKIVFDGEKVLDLCRTLQDGVMITINSQQKSSEEETSFMEVSTESTRSQLKESPKNSLQPLKVEVTENHQVEVPVKTLRDIISQIVFIVDPNAMRLYLTGMLLEVRSGELRGVTTDGHRLAVCRREVAGVTPPGKPRAGTYQATIPQKTISYINRVLERLSPEDKVVLSLGTTALSVNAGEYTVSTKLLDGKFPDYEKVMPNTTNKEARINRGELRQALSRVAIIGKKDDPVFGEAAWLKFKKKQLQVEGKNNEGETTNSKVPISYQGEPLEIKFNYNYIKEIISVMQSEELYIKMTDSDNSALLEEIADREKGEPPTEFVVMPISS